MSQFYQLVLTTNLSLLTFVINVTKISSIKYFWSVEKSLDILDELKSVQVPFSTIDSYDFSSFHTTFPYKIISKKAKIQVGIPMGGIKSA